MGKLWVLPTQADYKIAYIYLLIRTNICFAWLDNFRKKSFFTMKS